MGRRGTRYTLADCLDCGKRCQASDLKPDAHRMWAQRHADRTGHEVHVVSESTRVYRPKPTATEEPPR